MPNRDADFEAFWEKEHNTRRRALAAAGVTSWNAFREFSQKSDLEILEIKGIGPSILWRIREVAFEKGYGPDPGGEDAYYQRLQDGPEVPGFGPTKKFGLTPAVLQFISTQGFESWDDVAAVTNAELWGRVSPRVIWELRTAQFLAGRGESPGSPPRFILDDVRLRHGTRTDQPLPPFTDAELAKIDELHTSLTEALDLMARQHGLVSDLAKQILAIARGHVEDPAGAAALKTRCPSLGSFYLLGVSSDLCGELTGWSRW